MNKKGYFLSILFILVISSVSADIKMPALFADGMVFQQSSNAPVWGKATPASTIQLQTSWDNKKYTTIASSDSTWKVVLITPKASFQTYEIIISEKRNKISIKDVLIGEVWLCAGQSNMEMPMKGFENSPIDGSLEEFMATPNHILRCFNMQRDWSGEPKLNCKGKWIAASPSETTEFTAVGYFFGKYIQQIINVPIGLLNINWGGSNIETWMSKEALHSFPGIKLPVSDDDIRKKNQTPTYLFNGMMSSVISFPIRGAIWYQGESNIANYREYPDLFAAMHNDWQNRWHCGKFPIYICQIAPFKYAESEKNLSAFFREAQLKISQTQPNTGIAILSDVGEEKNVHPSNKKQVGQRLALQALAKTYGFNQLPFNSPECNFVEFKEGKANLTFKYTYGGLLPKKIAIKGFEIAAVDRKFKPAIAIIEKDKVIVSSDSVQNPVAVRYMFKNFTVGNLTGINGLPVSSFKTDNWEN